MHVTPPSSPPNARDLRIAVVVSSYHGEITGAMRDAAAARYRDAGGRDEQLQIVVAPGAFEIPVICRALARRGTVDAIVALGCVITGETTHDRYISAAVANGLTQLSLDTGVPMAFGILTCQTVDQAKARAGGSRGNKGEEAMDAAIRTAMTIRELHRPTPLAAETTP